MHCIFTQDIMTEKKRNLFIKNFFKIHLKIPFYTLNTVFWIFFSFGCVFDPYSQNWTLKHTPRGFRFWIEYSMTFVSCDYDHFSCRSAFNAET